MKEPEQRFIELMGEYKIEIFCDTFPNAIIYKNMKSEWLIWHDQKSGETKISWHLIWLNLEREYNMQQDEVKALMRIFLYKYFKIQGTIPRRKTSNQHSDL